jgi:SAM-dependent methyltransferase
MTDSFEARVERERQAHEDDDVLGRNRRLKQAFFRHTTENAYAQRFEESFEELIRVGPDAVVLEIGCGLGESAVRLAKQGPSVHGIDISQPYVDEANAAALAAGVADRCDFRVMDCHRLEYPEASFDLVFGKAILHHLDLHVVLKEIQRVLKPGGCAVFVEPLAANPLLWVFRLMTPKARTVDERPLSVSDLARFRSEWDVRSQYYGLLCAPVSAATSLLRLSNANNLLVKMAGAFEARLNRSEAFHPYNQHALLHLVKRSDVG